MILIKDIEKYKEYVTREIDRKSKTGGKKIFFDYNLRFYPQDVTSLREYLNSKYPDVEMRMCATGFWDIIIQW